MYPNAATLLATGGVGILVTSTWKVIVTEPPAGMLLIGIPVEGSPAVGVPLTVTLFGMKVVPAGMGSVNVMFWAGSVPVFWTTIV
ncbi:hypothetical protein bcgnr5388_41620 [Bacillus cereus]